MYSHFRIYYCFFNVKSGEICLQALLYAIRRPWLGTSDERLHQVWRFWDEVGGIFAFNCVTVKAAPSIAKFSMRKHLRCKSMYGWLVIAYAVCYFSLISLFGDHICLASFMSPSKTSNATSQTSSNLGRAQRVRKITLMQRHMRLQPMRLRIGKVL